MQGSAETTSATRAASSRRAHKKLTSDRGDKHHHQRGQYSDRSGGYGDLAKKQKTEKIITFSKEDAQGIQFPHNNAVVVSLNIMNYDVYLANVLFYDVFFQYGYFLGSIEKSQFPTHGVLQRYCACRGGHHPTDHGGSGALTIHCANQLPGGQNFLSIQCNPRTVRVECPSGQWCRRTICQ